LNTDKLEIFPYMIKPSCI